MPDPPLAFAVKLCVSPVRKSGVPRYFSVFTMLSDQTSFVTGLSQ